MGSTQESMGTPSKSSHSANPALSRAKVGKVYQVDEDLLKKQQAAYAVQGVDESVRPFSPSTSGPLFLRERLNSKTFPSPFAILYFRKKSFPYPKKTVKQPTRNVKQQTVLVVQTRRNPVQTLRFTLHPFPPLRRLLSSTQYSLKQVSFSKTHPPLNHVSSYT